MAKLTEADNLTAKQKAEVQEFDRLAADRQSAEQRAGAAPLTEAPAAPAPPAPGAAPAPAEPAPPAPLWEPHEHIPSEGGSFLRQPDGSLTKAEEA